MKEVGVAKALIPSTRNSANYLAPHTFGLGGFGVLRSRVWAR